MEIETKEFKNLKNMLLSSDEDFEVAIQNLNNLKLKPIYSILLAKNLSLEKRKDFFDKLIDSATTTYFEKFKKSFKRRYGQDYESIDLSWKTIYLKIKEDYTNDEEVKEAFKFAFANEFKEGLIMTSDWDFINDVELNITW
jgi:hypothetical protein